MVRLPTQAVIADAGPLIAFARLDRLEILHRLYGSVIVPSAVWAEVTSPRAFDDVQALQTAQTKAWLDLAADEPIEDLGPSSALWMIDPGERAAIMLALKAQQQGIEALLILDDAAARQSASIFGLQLIGTLGILMRAKAKGLIEEVVPLALQLRRSGYYFSDALLSAVAARMSETLR